MWNYPDSKFMGPTWGPSGAGRTQVGPMLVPWTLLSGYFAANTPMLALGQLRPSSGALWHDYWYIRVLLYEFKWMLHIYMNILDICAKLHGWKHTNSGSIRPIPTQLWCIMAWLYELKPFILIYIDLAWNATTPAVLGHFRPSSVWCIFGLIIWISFPFHICIQYISYTVYVLI